MLNRMMLIGRLTRKPELRRTQSDKAVTSFTVVTNEKHGDTEEAMFHDVVAWEKTAENAVKYLDKGSLVFVEGRIQKRKYTAKDGTERTAVEVVAQVVKFLDRKSDRPDNEALRAEAERIAGPLPDSRGYQPREVSTNARNGPHGDWSREETQRAIAERKSGAAVEEPPQGPEELPF